MVIVSLFHPVQPYLIRFWALASLSQAHHSLSHHFGVSWFRRSKHKPTAGSKNRCDRRIQVSDLDGPTPLHHCNHTMTLRFLPWPGIGSTRAQKALRTSVSHFFPLMSQMSPELLCFVCLVLLAFCMYECECVYLNSTKRLSLY